MCACVRVCRGWGDGQIPAGSGLGCLTTHLGKEYIIKQQLCLGLIFRDVGIGIHSKDFRRRGQRQGLRVLDVAFVLQRRNGEKPGG